MPQTLDPPRTDAAPASTPAAAPAPPSALPSSRTPALAPPAAGTALTRDQQQARERKVAASLLSGAPIAEAAKAMDVPADSAQAKPPTPPTATPPPGGVGNPGTPNGTAPPAPATAPGTGSAVAPEAATREAHAIATATLKRDGMGDKAIRAILESHDSAELSALVDTRRREQAARDTMGNRVRDLEAGKGRPGQAPPKPNKQAAPPPDPSEGADADELGLGAVADYFERIGDSQGAAVLKAANEKTRAKLAALEAAGGRNGQAEHQNGQQPAEVSDQQILTAFGSTVNALAATFPGLKDPAEQVALVRSADRLMRAGAIEAKANPDGSIDVLDSLTRAAHIRYPADADQAAQLRLAQTHTLHANGQPSPKQGASPPQTQPQTRQEKEKRAIELLKQGIDPREVNRRIYGDQASG